MNRPDGFQDQDPRTGPIKARSWETDVPRVFLEDRTPSRAAVQFFVILVLFVGAVSLGRSGWKSGDILYGTLEAISSVLAFVTGALALVRFYSKKQETFLFIGTGFLGTGVLDLFTAVLTTGWSASWDPGELEWLATWSFTASGSFLALFLLGSWVSWWRTQRDPKRRPAREATVYLTALLLGVVFLAVFDFFPLGGFLRPDRVIRQPVEFIPGLLFLAGATAYLLKRHWGNNALEHWLIVGLLISVMAHGAFMPFSSEYHDGLFVAAHALKVASYGSVLIGLLASVYVTFRREEEVAETTRDANTALAREIDFRRKAERVIQESEARLQDFLDNAHDLIQSVDPEGTFGYVNRAWKQVLGYSDEDLEDLSLFDILDQGCQARCRREFSALLEGEALPVMEMDFVAADGRVVRCSGSSDLWSEDGKPKAVRSILRDITEQVLARQKLEAFQANLRALVENTGDAIWSVDREKRLITFNTAFSMSTEVRTNREPRVGDRPADCLPSGDVEWYEERYERALSGDTFSELRDEEIGGQMRSFEFFFNPIREISGITGVAAFGQDVTARRRTQEALRMAKDNAEHANRAKSQFLASMSHELRTPLNSVIGFTNILLKNRNGNLAEKELSFLERITANGKHLLGLINEVLDLAKIEAGRMELEAEEVDLSQLLEETVLQLEGQVKGKGVRLRSEVPEGAAAIHTDLGKLKQVIINLVGNALKFTRKGEVVLAVSVQEDGSTPSAIAVRDTGIGISRDRLQAIFEAFEQADATTHREFGGTGLGLTISRSLCQLMGYDLRVESREGEGSTFTILLTESSSAERRAEEELMAEALRPMESSRPPSGTGKRDPATGRRGQVLLIDDDSDARNLLGAQLQDLGLEVRMASSAAEGLRMARDETPDLITLDLIMPEMTGWEALREFKNAEDLQTIPVVVVSVVAGEQDRGSLFGAVDLLTKPVDRAQLLQVVRRNLPDLRGHRILVVDDDPSSMELIRGNLEGLGLQVSSAKNGAEAEEVMSHAPFDLILLDLIMPVMDGATFLRRLREDPERSETPVVICTGKSLTRAEREKLASEAGAILSKGANFESRLREAVTRFFPPNLVASPESGGPMSEGGQPGGE